MNEGSFNVDYHHSMRWQFQAWRKQWRREISIKGSNGWHVLFQMWIFVNLYRLVKLDEICLSLQEDMWRRMSHSRKKMVEIAHLLLQHTCLQPILEGWGKKTCFKTTLDNQRLEWIPDILDPMFHSFSQNWKHGILCRWSSTELHSFPSREKVNYADISQQGHGCVCNLLQPMFLSLSLRFLADYDEQFPIVDDISLLQQAFPHLYPLL